MKTGIYIIAIFTFFVQIENREEFEGLHEKRKVIKHTLKYLYEAQMTAKKSTKTGKNFRGGWGNFSG